MSWGWSGDTLGVADRVQPGVYPAGGADLHYEGLRGLLPGPPGERQKVDAQPMISEEEIAAIATALKIYRGALHDRESEVLTILNIKRAYSPWNSKIHGLTQLPDRR